jgi:hypothetical protein
MGDVIREVVNEYITQTSSQNNSQGSEGEQVVYAVLVERKLFLADLCLEQKIGDEKCDDVHQAIPSHFEWTHFQKDRVEIRIWDHGRVQEPANLSG